MDSWTPINRDALQALVNAQFTQCPPALRSIFEARKVDPYLASIRRPYSQEPEQVFVVARKDDVVMYYEDVEEGFNLSPISNDGWIVEPGFEQDILRWALAKWTDD
jgi:hypothetical protein